jgi:NAD(P)-dependent dehydrogenase (short-subunit alcohol dehydrogenase family)
MRVLVTGATGFVGRVLCLRLLRDGHQVVAWVRNPDAARQVLGAQVEAARITADDDALVALLERVDAIVNLAGEPIIGPRWTAERKRRLVDSRVDLTERLVRAIGRARTKPSVLVSASAVGLYGDQLEIAHGAGAGWTPVGPERLVTKTIGNVIHELDGQTATERYCDYLGPLADDLVANSSMLPMEVRDLDDHVTVRSPRRFHADGSVAMSGDVPQGATVRLLRASPADLAHDAALLAPAADAVTTALARACEDWTRTSPSNARRSRNVAAAPSTARGSEAPVCRPKASTAAASPTPGVDDRVRH